MPEVPSILIPFQDGYRMKMKVSKETFKEIARVMRQNGYRYTGSGIFRPENDRRPYPWS